MSSRLQKQKQILSLLNNRTTGGENGLEAMDQGDPEGSAAAQHRLLSQVYQFHKSIIQNINAGLIAIDPSGEIIFANKKTASLLDTQVQELLGSNLKTFFVEQEQSEKFLKLCALPEKRIEDWDTRFHRGDGQEIIVGINASAFEDVNNDFRGVVLLLRDLTEIQQLRHQVERMERLALLGELAAGIAHEVRNPLAGIKAATQMLEDRVGDDEFQSQLTGRIVKEVDKANRLLKEFFKFARPAPPRAGFHSLEKIIDSVYLLIAPRLKQSRIQFDASYRNSGLRVYVDETQLEQVILNLFINALEAMEAGGELKVKVQQKKLDLTGIEADGAQQDVLYAMVEISDDGTGIPDTHLKRIFNPFFTTKSDGLGLGLSICSRLIQANGGKIDVRSQGGRGTTFILALPTFAH